MCKKAEELKTLKKYFMEGMKYRTPEISEKIEEFMKTNKTVLDFDCFGIRCRKCPFDIDGRDCISFNILEVQLLSSLYLKLPLEGGNKNG